MATYIKPSDLVEARGRVGAQERYDNIVENYNKWSEGLSSLSTDNDIRIAQAEGSKYADYFKSLGNAQAVETINSQNKYLKNKGTYDSYNNWVNSVNDLYTKNPNDIRAKDYYALVSEGKKILQNLYGVENTEFTSQLRDAINSLQKEGEDVQSVYDQAMTNIRNEHFNPQTNSFNLTEEQLAKALATEMAKIRNERGLSFADSTEAAKKRKANLKLLNFATHDATKRAQAKLFPLTVEEMQDTRYKMQNPLGLNAQSGNPYYNELYRKNENYSNLLEAMSKAPNMVNASLKTAETSGAEINKLNGLDATMHDVINGRAEAKGVYEIYSFMEEEERYIYNFLASLEDPKEATEYIEHLKPTLEERKAEDLAQKMDEAPAVIGGFAEFGATFGHGVQSAFENIVLSPARLAAAIGGVKTSHAVNRAIFKQSESQAIRQAILKSEDNAIWKTVLQVTGAVAEQVPALALGFATGGVGYSTALTSNIVSSSIQEAAQSGQSLSGGLVYGLVSSALELSIEKLTGGIGSKFLGGKSGKVFKQTLSIIDDVVKRPGLNALAKWFASSTKGLVGEGIEEAISGILDPALRNIILGESNKYDEETLKGVLEQAIIGALSGFALGGLEAEHKKVASDAELEAIGKELDPAKTLRLAERVGLPENTPAMREIAKHQGAISDIDPVTLGRLSREIVSHTYGDGNFMPPMLNFIAKNGSEQKVADMLVDGDLEAARKIKQYAADVEHESFLRGGGQIFEGGRSQSVGEDIINFDSKNEAARKAVAQELSSSPRDLASERTSGLLNKTVGVLNTITAANPKADVMQDAIAKSSGVKRLSDNQKILRKIGQSFGAKVEFSDLDYTVDGKVVSPEGQYDPNTNTITLNTNVKDYHRPVQFILKHELSHSLEKAGKAYERFMAEVELSEEFEKYAKSRYAIDERTGNAAYFKDVDEWYDYIIEEYKKANKPLGNETTDERTAAKMEAVADFVADKLFGGRDADMQKLLEAFQPETRKTFIEWVKGVFAKIKQVFKGRTELTEIENLEKQFLDVAKKVAKMNEAETEQQKTTTDEGSGENLDKESNKSYSIYNEYATNIMIWANSASTKVGDIKIFKVRDGFALIEATDDGYIELARSNYKEVKAEYERAYKDADNEIYGNLESIRADKGRNIWNMQSNGERGDGNRDTQQAGSQRFQADTTRNNEDLRRGNKGKQSVKFSLPQNDIKQRQLEIIQETNPMWDNYHTGIRTVDDIHTWSEVLELNDEREGQFVWGDFSREDAEQALNDGTITVYSSHPIKNGAFVSTSYIQAQEYAGGKGSKVYSKTIPLTDAAWINGDEGQYAKVDNIRYSLPPNATQREIADAYKRGQIDFAEYEKRINKLFDDKIQQNGAIKGGQIIAPPNKRVSVPESVSTDTKVRQHIRTILESGYATPEMEAYFKELILDGKYSYTPTSDSKNIARATKNITRQGYENAKYNWEKAIDKSGTGAEAVATGEALLRLAFEHKNVVDIVNLSAELAEFGTRTAQSLQAFSLLKKMGGLGQLVYIQRTVNRLNADLEKRFKKNPPVVKIDGKLAERLAKAKTEGEYEVIYGKIMQDIASQVPPTFLDKWHAWRYMAMLFNPTTHVRNFVGNGIFIPAVRMKNLLAAAMEKTISVDKRTKSVIIGEEYKQYAANDFENVKDILTGSGKYNPSDAVSEYRRIFKTKFLESARKFNFDLLENEDLIFLKAHYNHALASFLQARKLDVKNISESQLVQAREYAINEALKATYRDAERVANMITQLSKAHPVANVLVEGMMPFKKTPINILKRGAEYSPVGLIKTATYGIYELKSGKISASQFIDGLASGFTGSIVAAMGAFLAALGVAKGSFDDEEKWFRKMNGEQEFSIEIAGKSYTIDWAAPASIPFFIGVAIAEYNADEDADILSMIYDFGMAGFNPMLQLSMLSGIEDVIASVSYAEKGRKVAALAGATIKSYFAQALPTIFGKTANLFDDTRRTSYIDKTSNVPELVQKAWDKIAQKVPFVSKTRAEYIDAWGNTKYTGNFIQRFFQQYVSPGQASTVNVTDISEEISRLHKVTGESGIYPETPEKYFKFRDIRRDLSKEEYFEYATFKGKTQAELVDEAIHSKEYKSLTDEQKVTVIKNLYKYAGALAKCQLDYSYEEISAMVGENKKGEKILTKEKYDKLNDEARRLLVIEYFTESASVVKAYKSQKNGKSVVEYFIKKALTDK